MTELKKSLQYFFSVEGFNEEWYFEHLQKLINNSTEISYKVDFRVKIEKSPVSRMKSITIPTFGNQKIKVFHISDYESNDKIHQNQFYGILDELKSINTKNSNYKFELGYSNFAFELWLLLHKEYNFTSLLHRDDYTKPLNNAYGTNFVRIKENKHREPFHKLLSQIELSDVKRALKNAEKIRPMQIRNGYSMVEYKGFQYFRKNPDLTVNECVKQILKDCKII